MLLSLLPRKLTRWKQRTARGSGIESMVSVSANHLRAGFNPTPSVNRYEPVTDSKIEEYGMALLDGAPLGQIPDTHLMGAMEFAKERFDKQVLVEQGDRELTVRYVDRRDGDKAYFVSHSPAEWSNPDQDYHSLIANEVACWAFLPLYASGRALTATRCRSRDVVGNMREVELMLKTEVTTRSPLWRLPIRLVCPLT